MKKIIKNIKQLLSNFKDKSNWFKFGVLVAIFTFFFGIYCSTILFRLYHYKFYITAPFFAFFVYKYFWKEWFKNQNKYTYSGILIISILSAIIVTFLSLFVEELIIESYSLITSDQIFKIYLSKILIFGILCFYIALTSIWKLYFVTILIPFIIGVYLKITSSNPIIN